MSPLPRKPVPENGMDIDFVIPWVDGNDPAWLAEKTRFAPRQSEDGRDIRFRDWDLLRYWFRAIETHAPWVHRIFFVTWGHLPPWLDASHPKLRIVKHAEYIPGRYLPTFSSHPIELNLHRIPDLAEHFVYFNDDVFVLRDVRPSDFFVDGLPCDCLVENPITPLQGDFSSILCATMAVVNKHFAKKAVTGQGWKYWNPAYKALLFRSLAMRQFNNILGFYNPHVSQAHLKSTFAEVWDAEFGELDRTCLNRFRCPNDVNQYVFRYWNLCSGRFHPKYPLGRNVKLSRDLASIRRLLFHGPDIVVTLNDVAGLGDFEERRQAVVQMFETLYPGKSSFEV